METNIIDSKPQINNLQINNKQITNNPLSEFQQILYKLSDLSIQIGMLRAEINDLKNQRNLNPMIPDFRSPFQHTYRRPPQWTSPNYI
jgi:hypothetical protein